jgi:hypothetical protein
MRRFQESAAGQLFALAVALPLGAGALNTWSSEGSGMVWIIASIFAGIILVMFGLGSAVGEFDTQALWAILVLPPALLLYTPIAGLASTVPVIRVAMAFAAVILLGTACRPTSFAVRFASRRRAVTHSG